MQDAVTGAAQTQQWSFILSQLFAWVMAGLAWIVPFQSRIFEFVLQGESFWSLAGMSVLLLLPAAVFIAGIWGTMVSLYTIPFRLGRSVTLLQSVALSWWDALRMVWFYWAGLVKFLIVLVGWVWGLLKLSVQLIIGTLKSAITSPLAMLDAMTPWLAQQGVQLTAIETIGLAFFAWVGVRGMTWFLFGRFGAPAMIGLLSRQAFAVQGSVPQAGPTAVPDYWKGPISALKAEREWFRKESRELFELASLPVLQVVASGMNFLFVVFTGRGHFTLPFKSIDDVLAATHFPARVSGEVAP